MSEQIEQVEQVEVEAVEQPVEEVQEAEEVVQAEEVEEVESLEPETDVVDSAVEENKRLKQQLEDIKNDDSNVLEQNEALKAELERAEALSVVTKENAELKAQLEGIKRKSITDNLITTGVLNEGLRDWADSLTFKQLDSYAKNAPKRRNILQEKNETVSTDDKMAAFNKEQRKSRIL